ncbi:hypothetical protein [Marinitoga litoralis]|uniref:hypothetical protein n=1 Tax=Marinitoga litoralis TaxID=570855 RepID=UPI0019618848|nr:hypothetical protein [Marinitoga litoralis]MBM7560010.1 hypothetical protein [Marinitoga litoralis]
MKKNILKDFFDFITSDTVLISASIGLIVFGGMLIYQESKKEISNIPPQYRGSYNYLKKHLRYMVRTGLLPNENIYTIFEEAKRIGIPYEELKEIGQHINFKKHSHKITFYKSLNAVYGEQL